MKYRLNACRLCTDSENMTRKYVLVMFYVLSVLSTFIWLDFVLLYPIFSVALETNSQGQ